MLKMKLVSTLAVSLALRLAEILLVLNSLTTVLLKAKRMSVALSVTIRLIFPNLTLSTLLKATLQVLPMSAA